MLASSGKSLRLGPAREALAAESGLAETSSESERGLQRSGVAGGCGSSFDAPKSRKIYWSIGHASGELVTLRRGIASAESSEFESRSGTASSQALAAKGSNSRRLWSVKQVNWKM